MSDGCTPRFRDLIDRAFVRGLGARQRRRLREHLAICESCRERHDRLAKIERRLGGPRLGDNVIDDIERNVLAETAEPSSRRRRWIGVSAGLVAAAAAALLLVYVQPSESTLTPRGSAGHGRTPGLRLFCIDGVSDRVRAEASAVSNGSVPELRCMLQDDLQLAYTTPDHEGLTMVAFARRDSSVVLYAPIAADVRSLPLRADRIDEVLDWSTRLSAEHRPGRYDVVVRYFDREVEVDDAVTGRAKPLVELHARLEVSAIGDDDAH